jgi:hypothetical protein
LLFVIYYGLKKKTQLQFFKWVTQVLGQIIKMRADAPIPPNTMNAAAPKQGAPAAFLMIKLLKPFCPVLPMRGSDEGRPHIFF